MGFFDFCCPISGLSLRASPAVHIALLEATPGAWRPLSLPLAGRYDRGGSIDGFRLDFRTDLLVAGFVRCIKSGRVVASARDEYAAFSCAPSIARLLHLFERVNTMSKWGAMPFTLDGRQLRQILIHADVFTAIAPLTARPQPPTYEELEQQLVRSPLADQGREIFEEIIIADDVIRAAGASALTQLSCFDRWLNDNHKPWSPTAKTGQFCAPDDLRLARAAHHRLTRWPELQAVVDRVLLRLESECA
ncbi:MAG: hypothetical protein MUF64_18600 [Polyangiaceae bacterium]|nr:hypothetical protein [Polyangiaceae bacterium]